MAQSANGLVFFLAKSAVRAERFRVRCDGVVLNNREHGEAVNAVAVRDRNRDDRLARPSVAKSHLFEHRAKLIGDSVA